MSSPAERWEAQEHARRVALLGEGLARSWESVVQEHCTVEGRAVPAATVLQLMEDVYRNAAPSS